MTDRRAASDVLSRAITLINRTGVPNEYEQSIMASLAELKDALAAGLVVPAGLTAERLRKVAQLVRQRRKLFYDPVRDDTALVVEQWATVLELRETP